MDFYEVRKIYQGGKGSHVVTTGLTLQEAQKLCSDPETSSMTARKPRGCDGDEKQIQRWHEKQKHWFYGYNKY